jgi:HTH-type transcriptional regulator/antitoxin HipB
MKTVRSLGLRARHLRVAGGLSQQELANRALVSRKWLIDFEAGKASVEANKVMDVFQALGFEVELAPIAPTTEASHGNASA